jgi:D-alanyl-D-alanine carboxypeptidase (penicillin-binding protein 5/6)
MRDVAHLLRVVSLALLAVVVLVAAGTAAVLATTRLQAAVPPLTPALTSTASWAAGPSSAATIAPPDQGSLALAAVFDNVITPLASTDAQAVRPIASVAKTMTALVILETKPVLPGQAGPTLTITQQDVNDYHAVASNGGSYARVVLGEHLTERDLLIGLMLPSANNFALTAARWIDGSVNAFVSRLNARARALGMQHTHFADPDGLDQATTSTAADLLVLGETVIRNDALLSVVSTVSSTLPDGTAVQNLNILLGLEPGWVGIKTGWTPAAGGCLLFAARRILAAGAPPLTMVGAALNQPRDGNVDLANPELGGAFDVARTAVDTAYAGFSTVGVGPASIPVTGHVFGPWGAYTTLEVKGPAKFVLLHSGDSLSVATSVVPITAPANAGAPAGSVTVSLKGTPVGTWALTTTGRLPGPSPWWKLLAG